MRMMSTKQMRPIVELELRQYRDNKILLSQFAQRGLKERSIQMIRQRGKISNPTQAEALKQLDPPAWVLNARRWAWAIEQARELFASTAKKKEQLMVSLYGLDKPIRYPSQPRTMMLLLVSELGMSEPTLYKWREEIIQEVIAAAIQAGALKPYDWKQSALQNGSIGS